MAQASFTSRLKLSGYCGLKVLRPITPSSAAVCKLRDVEYFCEAKPHKRYLQTVQPRSGVLQRLVMNLTLNFYR